jgi:hypothetical protein
LKFNDWSAERSGIQGKTSGSAGAHTNTNFFMKKSVLSASLAATQAKKGLFKLALVFFFKNGIVR